MMSSPERSIEPGITTPIPTPSRTHRPKTPLKTPLKTSRPITPLRTSQRRTRTPRPKTPRSRTPKSRTSQRRRDQLLQNLEQDFEEDESRYIEEEYHPTQQSGDITLRNLIEDLRRKIRRKDPYVSNIKRPNLLLEALTELDDMIGMERLKKSAVLQVLRLIDELNSGNGDLGMLNTVLYGDPGVGKTNVGIILAKIWYGMGFLENNVKSGEGWMANMSDMDENTLPIIIAMVMAMASYMFSGGRLVYNRYGTKGVLIATVIVIIAILILWTVLSNRYGDMISGYNLDNDSSSSNSGLDSSKTEIDRSIVKVVSRKDLVAEYLGQSAPKTMRVLNANLGKVLFVDEVYSLYNPGSIGGDMYGMEVLTTINQFMSENPGKIVIIFAGYENLMKEGIFKAQPGLVRRFMWQFQCDGYDGDQLADIFLLQLRKKGWRVNDREGVKRLIGANAELFPSHGGDTERLIFYSQLASSQHSYREGGRTSQHMLTTEDVSEGLRFLAENNIRQGEDVSTGGNKNNDLREMLQRMEGLTQ